MITLACLDMAGTTVRDDGAVLTAFGRALDEIGVEAGTARRESAERYTRDTMGQSKIEVFRVVTEGDSELADRCNRSFEKAYLDEIATGGAQPVAGALDVIRSLREGGIRTVLTTGFSPATRSALLDALNWHDEVDLALSPADAGRGRPAPDLVLAAALRLGVDAVVDVCVVGDTTTDLQCGSNAGAGLVVGVLTGAHTRADLETAPHTHLLGSVAELPGLPELLAT